MTKHTLADLERRRLLFVVNGELNTPEQYKALRKAVDEYYYYAHKIYVGDGMYKGINLFDFNSYVLLVAEVDTKDNPWGQHLIDKWYHEKIGLVSIYGYALRDSVREAGNGKYYVYILMPVFNAEEYRKEVELESHVFSPAADPSILVWSDDVPFECLLAAVNKKTRRRRLTEPKSELYK